ncbi:aspartate carbamoyltransferase regulatory subunit [Caldisalinibacter kiritimatiensis]|uniref:Aspartate carbamoyltransferase regulatory chain (PyrI) n=1 Tax=Caldisalinibacter kiritimatiensis TaxID=1304284 RepID=R1ASW2_9FIRM|nr:aspartate carbamoyltransferase regulatory subunit [Caldisalinibacter kiritimatiensis]EOC99746.1 Aspartate carbamoyltransferase regulatory chain (PyrI) [Caldisalinibacter kiritimatiensis]
MLTVNSIKRGIVIDHIESGNGLKIFEKLKLADVEFPVVLLMNVPSEKLGKKDIIKIQDEIDLDLTMLGLIDPNITINIIEDDKIIEKKKVELPKKVKGLFKCDNPRCISNSDNYAVPTFTLVDKEKVKYKCSYCDDFTYL